MVTERCDSSISQQEYSRTKTREEHWGLSYGQRYFTVSVEYSHISMQKDPKLIFPWLELAPTLSSFLQLTQRQQGQVDTDGEPNHAIAKTEWHFFPFSCLLLGVPWVHKRNLRKAIPQRIITKKNSITLFECLGLYLYVHVLCIKREVPRARNIDSGGQRRDLDENTNIGIYFFICRQSTCNLS